MMKAKHCSPSVELARCTWPQLGVGQLRPTKLEAKRKAIRIPRFFFGADPAPARWRERPRNRETPKFLIEFRTNAMERAEKGSTLRIPTIPTIPILIRNPGTAAWVAGMRPNASSQLSPTGAGAPRATATGAQRRGASRSQWGATGGGTLSPASWAAINPSALQSRSA
jgi:hypothetical protein